MRIKKIAKKFAFKTACYSTYYSRRLRILLHSIRVFFNFCVTIRAIRHPLDIVWNVKYLNIFGIWDELYSQYINEEAGEHELFFMATVAEVAYKGEDCHPFAGRLNRFYTMHHEHMSLSVGLCENTNKSCGYLYHNPAAGYSYARIMARKAIVRSPIVKDRMSKSIRQSFLHAEQQIEELALLKACDTENKSTHFIARLNCNNAIERALTKMMIFNESKLLLKGFYVGWTRENTNLMAMVVKHILAVIPMFKKEQTTSLGQSYIAGIVNIKNLDGNSIAAIESLFFIKCLVYLGEDMSDFGRLFYYCESDALVSLDYVEKLLISIDKYLGSDSNVYVDCSDM